MLSLHCAIVLQCAAQIQPFFPAYIPAATWKGQVDGWQIPSKPHSLRLFSAEVSSFTQMCVFFPGTAHIRGLVSIPQLVTCQDPQGVC